LFMSVFAARKRLGVCDGWESVMAGRQDTRRRFEQWVKNPSCEANVISAVAGVGMAAVAKSEGLEPSIGQSPFALARGQKFEKALLENNGERLQAALIEKGALPDGAEGLADLRIRMNGGPLKSLDEAAAKTSELLRAAAVAGPDGLYSTTPAIISSATLEIPGQPVMLPDGKLAIDALLLRPNEGGTAVELAIGEIKTYPYRAGHTDSAELATARGQAGVYLHALRLAIDALGLSESFVCSPSGVLVMSLSGQNAPVVLPNEDLEFQAARASRGFGQLREAAAGVTAFDILDEALGIAKVTAAATEYKPECISFCDRAVGCRKAAENAGDAIVLGADVKRLLGETTLGRAAALLDGAEPTSLRESELAARFQDGRGEVS
jgi:hypothetical protein